jgi:osmotically-inducible protein OsmY
MYKGSNPSACRARAGAIVKHFSELACLIVATSLCGGCAFLPRATCSDKAFAEYMQVQAEKVPLPGIHELRTTAAGGHVTLGGRVDSPETLKELVKTIGATPGLTQLSFFGVEFQPPDVTDEEIVAEARQAAANAIGEEIASRLGFYCEDHRLFVYGTLPSSPIRERLDDAVRRVKGVGLYHVSCEIVLEDPPSDEAVAAAVRRKFRRIEAPNLTFRASQIDVRSVNNVVHLSGRAPTYLGKLSAQQQALQVEGVRYVINRIEVPDVRPTDLPPGETPPGPDTEVQSAALELEPMDDMDAVFVMPVHERAGTPKAARTASARE